MVLIGPTIILYNKKILIVRLLNLKVDAIVKVQREVP